MYSHCKELSTVEDSIRYAYATISSCTHGSVLSSCTIHLLLAYSPSCTLCLCLWMTALTAGKTVWSTAPPTWSGSFATQPSCCTNEGVTCGTVPGSSNYPSVLSIEFVNMGLSGRLPSEIGSFRSMTSFVMGANLVFGTIPRSIGNMTALSYLDVGRNLLTGTIPSNIGALTALQVFLMNQNKLTGIIPTSIGALRSMQVLSFDVNSLSGGIPPTIQEMTSLTLLTLQSNSLVGTIPSSLSTLTRLEALYIDRNSLTGTIPSTLTAIRGLRNLLLNNNFLTGTIPSTFSALTALDTLLLQVNYLTMGSLLIVPTTTFSQFTLDRLLDITFNCLVFRNPNRPLQTANATRCKRKIANNVILI